MSGTAIRILTPTTSATQSDTFTVGDYPIATIYRTGAGDMTAAEYTDLQEYSYAGEWHDYYDSGDSGAVSNQVRLHAGRHGIVIRKPGTYRFDKGATTENGRLHPHRHEI